MQFPFFLLKLGFLTWKDAKSLLAKLRRHRLDGKATRWVNNWIGLQVSKVEINHLKSFEWLVKTGVLQWLVLGPILFSLFTWAPQYTVQTRRW